MPCDRFHQVSHPVHSARCKVNPRFSAMAFPKCRIWNLLLVLMLAVVVFVVHQSEFSFDISPPIWTTFSRKLDLVVAGRWSGTNPTGWAQEVNPPVFSKAKYNSTVTLMRPTKVESEQGTNPETPMPILLPKNFSESPVWDFDDVYNQDAAPRQSTCQESVRDSQDESFRKGFLPNIRLFLYKDNINMSEWNRLSHFNHPYGFMGFAYDVMPSVKLIPRPQEPLFEPKPGGDGCIRCAVVGNAGILNGSKMGKEIDAHDFIFRMNGAVIKGYESDVGNKTSVYVHTAHTITTSMSILKKYDNEAIPHDEGIKYVLMPANLRDFQFLGGLLKGEIVPVGQFKNTRPRMYYGEQYNESRFYVLHQDFLRYLRNRFLYSPSLAKKHWASFRPTTGAITIFLALHTCDQVDAYGFMTEDHAKYSNYYYEREQKHVPMVSSHDILMEMKLWKQLHDGKVIRLYQRLEQKPLI
ncbi:alpha-N-acetylgalactosaminide alpha-2,6-sialyltransferase 1-like isoform X2 [Nerophis ophidion]|uniref:alpha-N-acetylgalactosaminide alpha-2,6-sialyltransferase 1-like isoform X2 n=1 Tax=Nerophis ophidion TaxID=159077 RepID=UPI002ADF861F|nr:alpha-N-acetylgalactosaminide alpha-2,6-sialyltransferase 1-like isoform X2 [Nerophis ophidion]